MAATVKEIAKIANVSTGTVDRALHNRSGVNKETADKIKSIAKDLNYQPNHLAKCLANTKKRKTIGVIINSLGNEFFDDVIVGIKKAESELTSYGVTLHISILKGYDICDQIKEIDKLLKLNINALAITPISDPLIMQKLNSKVFKKIPIVTINNDINGVNKLCFVGCDYRNSGAIAGQMINLITNSCAKVAIVAGSDKILGHSLRIEGFSSILNQYKEIKILKTVYNNDDDDLSYNIVKDLLQNNPCITALYFCAGGVIGSIKAVKELNLQNTIKIITVDQTKEVKNNLINAVISATITQQPIEQGYKGIMVLFDYLFHNISPETKIIFTQNEIKLCVNLD